MQLALLQKAHSTSAGSGEQKDKKRTLKISSLPFYSVYSIVICWFRTRTRRLQHLMFLPPAKLSAQLLITLITSVLSLKLNFEMLWVVNIGSVYGVRRNDHKFGSPYLCRKPRPSRIHKVPATTWPVKKPFLIYTLPPPTYYILSHNLILLFLPPNTYLNLPFFNILPQLIQSRPLGDRPPRRNPGIKNRIHFLESFPYSPSASSYHQEGGVYIPFVSGAVKNM